MADERKYASTAFVAIMSWLEDQTQRIDPGLLRDVIEAAKFLDMMDLLTACFASIIDELKTDDTSGKNLRMRLSPLPGNSGTLILDQVIEQCDQRAYAFLTDADDDQRALVEPETRQMMRWISAQVKLGPWKEEHDAFFFVEKTAWFRDSYYLMTLEVSGGSRPCRKDADKTMYVWDLRRRAPVLKVPHLYDAEIGPFDLVYTLDSDHVLRGRDPRTGKTGIDPPITVDDCGAIFASPNHLYTDPGYDYLPWDDDDLFENLEMYNKVRLWFKKEATDDAGRLCMSRSKKLFQFRISGRMVLCFSPDSSFALQLHEDTDLRVTLYAIEAGSPRSRGFLIPFDGTDACEGSIGEFSRDKLNMCISPDNTFMVVLWKGHVIFRSIPNRRAREQGMRRAQREWLEGIIQKYKVPADIRDADDHMAGSAISPDSSHVAIVTIQGHLILLQRKETSFEELFVLRHLRTLRMSRINKDVHLSWSPNGKFLAAGHDHGFDIIPIEEMIRDRGDSLPDK